MSELRVEGLIKRFGGEAAVDDVTLTVENKEFLVLLGPSGCGKSTLLRSIAGLETIDQGTISIGGVDVTERKPKDRKISMVFQNYAVFPHLSVGKNIAFGLERQGKRADEIERRVRSAAELLHIENLLERPPNSLSGGQRQRVAVARAIAYDSDLLLMDEPLSNLDALLRLEMRAELKRLVREIEATVIYVTHDQTEALSMGDRVAVMESGRLVQVDEPITIYDHPASPFVAGFIGNPPMNLLPGKVRSDGKAVLVGDGGLVPGAPPGAEGGAAVTVGIRAENLRIVGRPDDLDAARREAEVGEDPVIPVRVLVVEPLGSHNIVTIESGSDLLRLSIGADDEVAAGDTLLLAAAPDKVRWYS